MQHKLPLDTKYCMGWNGHQENWYSFTKGMAFSCNRCKQLGFCYRSSGVFFWVENGDEKVDHLMYRFEVIVFLDENVVSFWFLLLFFFLSLSCYKHCYEAGKVSAEVCCPSCLCKLYTA